MKKYISPATEVATLQVENTILAGSLNLNTETTTDQYAPATDTDDADWAW